MRPGHGASPPGRDRDARRHPVLVPRRGARYCVGARMGHWRSGSGISSSHGSARPKPRTAMPFGRTDVVGLVVVAVDDQARAHRLGQRVDDREAVRMAGGGFVRHQHVGAQRGKAVEILREDRVAMKQRQAAAPGFGWAEATPGRRRGCGRPEAVIAGCQTLGLNTPGRPATRRPATVATERPRSPSEAVRLS